MTITQRLILTPKGVPSALGGVVPFRPDIAGRLDPNPDFDLLDIRLELEDIERRQAANARFSSLSPDGAVARNVSVEPKRFGGNIADVADFGRGGFRMRLFDSDDDLDDLDQESDDSADEILGRRAFSTSVGSQCQERQGFVHLKAADVSWPQPRYLSSSLVPRADEIEIALQYADRERRLRVQDDITRSQVSFLEKLKEEHQRAEARLAQVEKEEVAKRERARRLDKQDQRSIAEARDQHLSILQRDHEQRSQVEERAIRKEAAAEEARKRERDRLQEQQRRIREEAEAEVRRKAEIEKEKAAAEAARRKAQAEVAAAVALQRAETERNAKLEAEQKATLLASEEAAKTAAASEDARQDTGNLFDEDVSSYRNSWFAQWFPDKQKFARTLFVQGTKAVPKPRVSKQAASLEDSRLSKLKELQDSFKHLVADPAFKKDFKVYERQVAKHVQQVSETQDQVRRKSADLIQLFRVRNGPPIQFLIVTLGTKILNLCESQPKKAFSLAQVVVNVASQVPFVMESMLGQLHQACILTVPKYYVFSKNQFGSDEAYYQALGYKIEGSKLESTDDFVTRMNAYVTFYAALTQTEAGGGGTNPHGLKYGWSWCARLLNEIPANRLSASALESFLMVAGYRLFQVYAKPFMKLMQTVVSEFLVNLKKHNDADAMAIASRLETYLHTGQFKSSPEGRNMPLMASPIWA